MASTVTSAGGGVATEGAAQTENPTTPESGRGLPLRAGGIAIRELIDLYMTEYAGRDSTRVQRLSWWSAKVGGVQLQDLSDDDVYAALEALAAQPSRHFVGKDADGKGIYKAKRKPLSPATINRYSAALGAVITWAIKRRIAPKGYVHPCRTIERKRENNERVRFLSDDERGRLLEACRASRWPKLYMLVMMALTTGARKGELLGLRWRDVDLTRALASCGRTKNGDPKVLPLVPAVIELLRGCEGKNEALVFGSARTPKTAYCFEARWAQARKQAGLKHFRFHDLRHSCASMLAQNGATLLQIGNVLGHRQAQMTLRYAHLAVADKSALVNRVLGDIR